MQKSLKSPKNSLKSNFTNQPTQKQSKKIKKNKKIITNQHRNEKIKNKKK